MSDDNIIIILLASIIPVTLLLKKFLDKIEPSQVEEKQEGSKIDKKD